MCELGHLFPVVSSEQHVQHYFIKLVVFMVFSHAPSSCQEAPGAGSIFMDVLWAMVFVIGLSVSLGICIVAVRHFKSGGAAPMYLPVEHAQQQQDEVEMASRQTGTTPDIVRIG
ncbi:unnamed protein product [Choristocarpus tenellus]